MTDIPKGIQFGVEEHILIVGSGGRLANEVLKVCKELGINTSGLDLAPAEGHYRMPRPVPAGHLDSDEIEKVLNRIVSERGEVTQVILMARHKPEPGEVPSDPLNGFLGISLLEPIKFISVLARAEVNRGMLKSVLFFGSPLSSFASHHQSLTYHFTKGGQVALARALALEFGRQGVRVNVLTPGFVRNKEPQVESAIDPQLSGQMLPNALSPVDIAKAAIMLGSDFASGITGQEIFVDAGSSAIEVFSAIDRASGMPKESRNL